MKTLASNLRVSFAVLLMFVAVSSLSAAQQYTVTDLGTLGGQYSGATAVNNLGQVVGFSDVAAGEQHAFVWTTGAGMLDIGVLPNDNYSQAQGINDAEEVVGWSTSGAFLWTKSKGMQRLGTIGGNGSAAFGINKSGQIVGYSSLTGDVQTHAVVWSSDGEIQDLGTLGGNYSYAQAINDAGEVAGYSYLADNITFHAFLWTSAGGIQDLGTLGGTSSRAYAINPLGQVVGWGYTPTNIATAFLWTQNQGMRPLGAGPGSVPFADITTQIVGISGSRPQYGFLWTPTQHLQNLNNLIGPHSGWLLTEATSINKHGQIGATGGGGLPHALLLTPTKQPSSQRSKP